MLIQGRAACRDNFTFVLCCHEIRQHTLRYIFVFPNLSKSVRIQFYLPYSECICLMSFVNLGTNFSLNVDNPQWKESPQFPASYSRSQHRRATFHYRSHRFVTFWRPTYAHLKKKNAIYYPIFSFYRNKRMSWKES